MSFLKMCLFLCEVSKGECDEDLGQASFFADFAMCVVKNLLVSG